ncbi:hypothetical protein [Sphingomonas sp.]|uniref:hypothetical protein n=1 Tax=Sphingomonas sp. TaxID=28214 RepID=UPI0035BC23B9
MEPIFYVMAILGCGDASASCTEARTEPARYQSVAQCRAALPQALARNTDLEYPTIAANCRASGERLVKASVQTPQG